VATHVSAASSSGTLPAWRRQPLIAGVLSGIAGGVVFGLMMNMAMPPMLGMIGSLVGAPGLGWLVHLVFSAIIGGGFGLVFGRWVTSSWGQVAGLGMVYGLIWWILGPLLIMPVWMGMGPMLSKAFDASNLLSLMGHLIFGLVTALVYRLTTR